MQDVITIASPDFDPYSGYGRMACELVAHLSQKDIHVNAIHLGKAVFDSQTPALQGLLKKPIRLALGGIVLGYPTLYGEYGALVSQGTRVAHTMFESTEYPLGWVQVLNECKAVTVPTPEQKKIAEKNGVRVPVHVTPLGISETFKYVDRSKRKYSEQNPFTFVCWGDRGMRKGWDVAVTAFVKAFGKRMDTKLIVKSRAMSFPFGFPENPNIEVMQEDFDEFGLQEFYAKADAMVFPSRGEGFGLPPREFAATGGPALVTDWWADNISMWGYPIRSTMVPAWQGETEAMGKWVEQEKFIGLGKWAEPNEAHLIQQMQYIRAARPEMLAYMGRRSAANIRQLYSWKGFAEKMYEVWQGALNYKTLDQKREARKARKATVNHASINPAN